MPSRKRLKGRQRKAIKAASKESAWVQLTRWGERNVAVQCNHGCEIIPQSGHIVYSFIQSVFDEMSVQGELSVATFTLASYKNEPQLWHNTKNRKMAVDILRSMGTNIILNGGIENAKILATMSSFLEHFKSEYKLAYLSALPISRDIQNGNDRDVMRNFHRKIACSCLKNVYKQSKCQPKVGCCSNCAKTFRRDSLMLCG